jgi:hypothetical protein
MEKSHMIKVKNIRKSSNTLSNTVNLNITNDNDLLADNDLFDPEESTQIQHIFNKLNSSETLLDNQLCFIISKLYNKTISLNTELQTLKQTRCNNTPDEFKPHAFTIPENIIIKFLLANTISSDILLFKLCYNLENIHYTTYPIKFQHNKYYYWKNSLWNCDIKGTYIKDTLSINLMSLYLNINNLDNLSASDMINNQIYISSMESMSYKNNLLSEIKDYISIDRFC